MKGLLEHIVKSIVDKPGEVEISEAKDPVAGTVLTISVSVTDMGKVIGKEGKIINEPDVIWNHHMDDIRYGINSLSIQDEEIDLPDDTKKFQGWY